MRASPTTPIASATARQRGFSLSEVLVALGVTSLLFVAALSMLSIDQKIYHKDDATLEASREARYAMELINRDLLMLGYQVDTRTIADLGPDGTANTDDDLTGQDQIAFAAPWELAINADIDPAIDAIDDAAPGGTLPSGYAPVKFHTGAETIRYTLDSSGDGTVDGDDRGDDAEEAVVKNPGLYMLRREVYGYNGTSNTNPSDSIALVRGPVAYPSGAEPAPLFLYWGDFDSDPALDLWGDTGAGGGTAGNGILEPGEIAALGPVTDEDADDDAVLDAGEDRNGNGILERRIGEIIRRIDITLTAETSYPDPNYEDPARSGSTTPWRFRSVTLTSQIKPRNIELPGGACGDAPEPTKSPAVTNACSSSLADGKVTLTWGLSPDDGNFEDDIETYLIFRTDQNNLFGTTPFSEVAPATTSWDDDWINMRTWPPRQYWYKVKAMDCTPQLSELDPKAGPYPAQVGAAYPPEIAIEDVANDAGDQLRVLWLPSPDEGLNATGYGGVVKEYWVYRSDSPDYRCQEPVHTTAIAADGSPIYAYIDNDTNSTSALVYGTLYYYWMRTKDDNGAMSPYSPRYCARAYQGPTFPDAPNIRIANRTSTDHPVEIWFMPAGENIDAGYDPMRLRHRIYRSRDVDGDGDLDSLAEDAIGYTSSDRVAELFWTGSVWAVGDAPNERFQASYTGGSSWINLGDPGLTDVNDIAFADRLRAAAIGPTGSVYVTADGGLTWTAPATGTAVELRDVIYIGSDIYVVGDAGTILHSDDDGASFTALTSGVTDDLHGIAGDEGLLVATGAGGAVLRSTDGGATWQDVRWTANDLLDVCLADDGSGRLWVTDVDGLWSSEDGGVNWTFHDFGAGATGQLSAVACQDGAGPIYASSLMTDIVVSYFDGGAPDFTTILAPSDIAMAHNGRVWVSSLTGQVHMRDVDGTWSTSTVTTLGEVRGIAARDEIIWQDDETKTDASDTPYFYVVTTAYAENDPLLIDGEAGMTPDRSSAFENPDDALDQILVDSCNDFQLSVSQP